MPFLHCFTRTLTVDSRALPLPRPIPRRAQTTTHEISPEHVHSEPYRKLVRDDSVPWRSQRQKATPTPYQTPTPTPIIGSHPRAHHNSTVRGPSEPNSMPSLSCTTYSFVDDTQCDELRKSSPHLRRSTDKPHKLSSARLKVRGWNLRRALDISSVWRRFTSAYRQQRSGSGKNNGADIVEDTKDDLLMEAKAESHVPMQPAHTELMPTPTLDRLPPPCLSVESSAVVLVTDSFTNTAVVSCTNSDCESGAAMLAPPQTDSDCSTSTTSSNDTDVSTGNGVEIAVSVRSDAYIGDLDSDDNSVCASSSSGASEPNSTAVTICASARALSGYEQASDCDADAGPADTTPIGQRQRPSVPIRTRARTPARRVDRGVEIAAAAADFDAWCDAESVVNSVLTDTEVPDTVFTPECVVVQRVDSFQLDSENDSSFARPPLLSKPLIIHSRSNGLPRRPSAPLPPHVRTGSRRLGEQALIET